MNVSTKRLDQALTLRALHGLMLTPAGTVVCRTCGPWRRWPCSRFRRAHQVAQELEPRHAPWSGAHGR